MAHGKEFTCQCRRCRRCGFDPWVRKVPGGINGNPLQYSYWENPMDRGARWATVPGGHKETQPSNWAYARTQIKPTQCANVSCLVLILCAVCCAVLSHSVMSDSVTLWTLTCQAPLSMGILQVRILELVAMSSFRGSSQPRDWTQVSHIAGGFFTIWACREAQVYWSGYPIPSLGDP